MGACMSSAGDSIHKSTNFAFIISTKGELRQYPTPIFVSEVLQFEKPSFFVCNSDKLYQDQDIPSLDSEDELDAGQIYFILPKTMLARRLSASDMASLAVKASLALDSNSNSNSHVKKKKNNKARISPMVLQFEKPSFFVCNSDNLYQDQDIPCLDSEDELDAGQIYFILPKTMLARRLSASDMASLAVKARLDTPQDTRKSSFVSYHQAGIRRCSDKRLRDLREEYLRLVVQEMMDLDMCGRDVERNIMWNSDELLMRIKI
ncbi:hypothetical protein CTI12_AA259720 [Artemisia annua]|uniref:Uncharacterized protein n=1 Tax=Artemisia annua TaxID=35608 RepID=A0A2U1NJ46_ARTAN|nr:hypothetical protein CTI12_AA259720 [Artemisia annua]